MIASEILPLLEAEAKERMERGRPKEGVEKIPQDTGKARDKAAALGEIRIALSPPFCEGWVSGKIDPLAPPMECSPDFDALDGADGADDEHRDKLVLAMRRFLEWTVQGVLLRPGADARIGRRCVALLWTVNPDYFQGSSLAKVGELLGLDKTRGRF